MLRAAAIAVVSASALAACSPPAPPPTALAPASSAVWSCPTDTAVARPASLPARRDSVRIVARARSGASLGALAVGRRAAARQSPAGLVRYDVPSTEAAAALAALRGSAAVEYAELDPVVRASDAPQPNDPWWSRQWAPVRTRAAAAWTRARGTAATVVAVLDSGVACDQPDLRGALLRGFDAVDGDQDPTDPSGHGTLVAGVLAARLGNGVGGAGICPECPVLPVRVLGPDGAGRASDVAEGIVWAVDRGARVLNLSLGTPEPSRALEDAVAYARSRGAVVVAAAGNDGSSAPQYPAALEGVIAVGATDDQDRPYAWTNRGPWVDVSAPGFNVAGRPDGQLAGFAGTSSAAPVVSAIAALAFAADPAASGADVERAIAAGLAPAKDGAPGRVDAVATLEALERR